MGKVGIDLLGGILALLQESTVEEGRCSGVIVGSIVLGKVCLHQRSRIEFALEDIDLIHEQNERRVGKQLVVGDRVEKHHTLLHPVHPLVLLTALVERRQRRHEDDTIDVIEVWTRNGDWKGV